MSKSSTQLMLRFKSGDEASFAALYEAHQRTVLNIVYRYLGSQAEAEDLAQEVFLRVYRSRERYSPQARFTTWLYRITANLCLNYQRDQKRHAQEALFLQTAGGDERERDELADPGAPEPGREGADREIEAAVVRAIAELPENQRMAVILNRYEELSYKEIAVAMDSTEKAVKSLLHRSRLALKERLERYLGEEDLQP